MIGFAQRVTRRGRRRIAVLLTAGMMGLAVTGAVMVQSFRSGVEAAVPDDVEAVLPRQLLASVKDDPRALVDPTTARALQESLAETGIGDVALADRLLHSLNLALTDALSDVFTVQL